MGACIVAAVAAVAAAFAAEAGLVRVVGVETVGLVVSLGEWIFGVACLVLVPLGFQRRRFRTRTLGYLLPFLVAWWRT